MPCDLSHHTAFSPLRLPPFEPVCHTPTSTAQPLIIFHSDSEGQPSPLDESLTNPLIGFSGYNPSLASSLPHTGAKPPPPPHHHFDFSSINCMPSTHNNPISSSTDQPPQQKNISLVLFNARSILNKLDALRTLVTTSDIDLLLVTETWLNADTPIDLISLTGYHTFRANRLNRRGGGCLVYVKSPLKASPIGHPTLEAVADSVWLSVTLSDGPILIGCIYRPPNSEPTDLQHIIEAFNTFVGIPACGRLIAGDFNLPNICWLSLSAPSNLHNFMSCLQVGNWIQHVLSPTRGPNILDLVFTSALPLSHTSVLDHFPGSDHRIIMCSFSAYLPTTKHGPRDNFRLADWKKLHHHIRCSNWDAFFLTNDPQISANVLYSNLSQCLQNIHQGTELGSKKKPLTIKLQEKYSKLHQAYHKSKDFFILMQLRRLSQYIQNRAETIRVNQERAALADPNSNWKLSVIYKSRTPKQPSQPCQVTLPDNTILRNPKDIADAFNDHFASNLTSDSLQPPTHLPHNTAPTLPTIFITLGDITRLLPKFKTSYHPGPDGLPPVVFTLKGTDIPILLLNTFTLSLKCSVFPSQWKTSYIIPRHKKGPSHRLDNYRPINLTPIVSRLFETIIKEKLMLHLMSNDLINVRQYGFMKQRSCLTCQYDFLNIVTHEIDKSNAIIIIFLDMTKAFDRVPHKLLLSKMRNFGIDSSLLQWFASFLSDRHQVVNIDGYLSQRKPVTSGVIQGSVLGPLLFLMYINDVFNVIRHGTPYLFADDIKIVYSFHPHNLPNTLHLIQADLQSLENWCTVWRMNFSADKCSYLSYKCTIQPGTLTLNNIPILGSTSVRDLGLQYSCTFNFSEYTSTQIARAQRTIGLVKHEIILPGSKMIIYRSHVRPLLEYCHIIFSCIRKQDRVAIENVQRSFTKYLFGPSTQLSYHQRCQLLKIEPLWLRRVKLNLCFLFKLIHQQTYSTSPQPTFRLPSTYPLRQRNLSLTIPRTRTALRENFFLNKYQSIWNKLPLSIRSIETLGSFKRSINEFFTVSSILTMLNCNIAVQQAYEEGIGF